VSVLLHAGKLLGISRAVDVARGFWDHFGGDVEVRMLQDGV